MTTTGDIKLINFALVTKDNTTFYQSVAEYVRESTKKKVVSADEIIEKDFVVELIMTYQKDGVESTVWLMSSDVESLMNWVKENHPGLYRLIPPFRIDQFEYLANEMKSSSHLSYQALDSECPLDLHFGSELEKDDFIPQRETVEESINEMHQKGFYTELHCYPNTPIGFWNYYGFDFQSLLDHLIED